MICWKAVCDQHGVRRIELRRDEDGRHPPCYFMRPSGIVCGRTVRWERWITEGPDQHGQGESIIDEKC